MTVYDGCCVYLYPDNEFAFGDIGEILTCETCGRKWSVCYDESYDEESGDKVCWFWLEKVE